MNVGHVAQKPAFHSAPAAFKITTNYSLLYPSLCIGGIQHGRSKRVSLEQIWKHFANFGFVVVSHHIYAFGAEPGICPDQARAPVESRQAHPAHPNDRDTQ